MIEVEIEAEMDKLCGQYHFVAVHPQWMFAECLLSRFRSIRRKNGAHSYVVAHFGCIQVMFSENQIQ